jgi:hypothetical protein
VRLALADVETRGSVFSSGQHALLDVVLGAALTMGQASMTWKHSILDRHHGSGRAFAVFVCALAIERIPAVDGFAENFRIDIDLRRDVFE